MSNSCLIGSVGVMYSPVQERFMSSVLSFCQVSSCSLLRILTHLLAFRQSLKTMFSTETVVSCDDVCADAVTLFASVRCYVVTWIIVPVLVILWCCWSCVSLYRSAMMT